MGAMRDEPEQEPFPRGCADCQGSGYRIVERRAMVATGKAPPHHQAACTLSAAAHCSCPLGIKRTLTWAEKKGAA